MKIRKIFIYLVIIIVIGAAIYLVWTFFVPKPIPPATNQTGTTGGALPGGTTGGFAGGNGNAETSTTSTAPAVPVLSKISSRSVLGYWIDRQTGDVHYIDPTGNVWGAREKGGDVFESQQPVNAINTIDVDQNGQNVLTAFGDPRSPQWAIYSSADKTWHALPQSIVNATWGANANQLIGIVRNANAFSLSFIDLAKNPPSYKTILNNFFMSDVRFKFYAPNTLLITEKPSLYYQASVWELNLKTLALNLIFQPQSGLYAEPSSDGSMIISSAGGTTNIVKLSTITPTPLPFQTLPNKCDSSVNASSSAVYCFYPENMPQNIVLPDDYLERAFYSIDILYHYSFGTRNTKTVILSGAPGIPLIDATDVASFGNNVYFVNRYDNALYQLALPSSGD